MEENIADALKMAGSVLLFVMGLSIAILYFSQARETIDAVLSYSDRESLTIENNPRFYYLSAEGDTNRYVGKETIIPALYRAYKENYKIVFEFNDDYYLFENSAGEKTKEIDLAKQSIGSDEASRQFLDGIIYGKDESGNKLNDTNFKERFNVTPNSSCLYDYLTSKESSTIRIKEFLGTYYMEDVDADGDGQPDSKIFDEKTQEWIEIAEANRTKKRVITYTFK